MKNKTLIEKLNERLIELAHLGSMAALLQWDQEVHMPPKGNDKRAELISYLSGLWHEKFVSIDSDKVLSSLRKRLGKGSMSQSEEAVVRETARSFDRARKIPKSFVEELAKVTSKANAVWAEARKKSNFKKFEPILRKIIELKRKEAEFIGYKESPYDALLDAYEPGLTAREAGNTLDELKNFLIPFVQSVLKSQKKLRRYSLNGHFPVDTQYKFNKVIAKKLGFDFEAGLIEKSVHPFTTNFNPEDVRFTTRYREEDAMYAIGSTIHETGHAIYEQGLPIEHFGTPLAESISLGIHESQSRFYENILGKSYGFWKYFYPKLQKEFPEPFKKISLADFYKIINKVNPSFIRTEADELTYSLHIIVRFEIERDMIEGKIDLSKLPKIWNEKMRQYLGVKVPSDALGVLQDVHWSHGSIGYFPTYVLGNLYAAQFYMKMKKDIADFDKAIAKGNFLPVKNWLSNNIHTHGKLYSAESLIKKVTGEKLCSRYFIEYLRDKYR